MSNFETIIGIEVHTQLNTKRKIFSPSVNDINAVANTNVHPIDLGFPGTLPRFNEEVLKKAILMCSAFEMDITKNMHWDRKNYFYPDNPKGYQITQFETPIGRNGKITLDNKKEIIIEFMHMEEDTAKSFHKDEDTLLDFNRCGIPLLEIVSAPSIRSAAEAREYLEKLRQMLVYLNVSDGKMEEGSLRVDVNVSIRPFGQESLNTKVEIKNLNSFQNVVSAIEMEVKNQSIAYLSGKTIRQATKRFNEQNKTLDVMRFKESMDDYRYIAEPDLPRIILDDNYVDCVIRDMPLTPQLIEKKLLALSIDKKTIKILMADKSMTIFYLKCLNEGLDYQQMLNYLVVNVNEYLNKTKKVFEELYVNVEQFSQIIAYLEVQKISTNHIKKIIPLMFDESSSALSIIEKYNLQQITDLNVIKQFCIDVLSENQESVTDFKNGKNKAFGFLVGCAMKKSKGQANPELINESLKALLNEI